MWGDVFQLEQGVLTVSTVVLCFGVFLWPIITGSFMVDVAGKNSGEIACYISGVAGLILSILLFWRYNQLKHKLVSDAGPHSS
jgi:hypothetical protein